MVKKWIVEIISLLFVLLFLYTAVYKIIDFSNFRAVIGQSPLITRFAPYLAVGVPLVEIIISGLLVFSRWRIIGLCASFALMLVFTFYIIILLNLHSHLPCSCGGIIQDMSWQQHLVFNIVFLLLSLTGIAIYKKDIISA
jgi:uncharacterized membrane protein YphA (DoxX/SURF4 family)